jgi:NADH:ubiquinone oxidoreductase subunit 2 (subunit N)
MRYHLTILDKPLPGKEILILPEFVLGFSLVFITGIILLNYDRYKEAPYALFIKNIALVSASINLSIAFLAAIYNYLDFKLSESDYNANSYEAVIILNSFTYFFKAMVGILIILSLLLLRRHWDIKNDAGVVAWERPLLMLASLLFMFLLISSNNLLVTFILIEGLSVCLYFILASELRGNSFTAVLMYFLLGSVSSILFGYALLRTY